MLKFYAAACYRIETAFNDGSVAPAVILHAGLNPAEWQFTDSFFFLIELSILGFSLHTAEDLPTVTEIYSYIIHKRYK